MDYRERVEARNRYAFTISYEGTEENTETHKEFQEFCKGHDSVYISGLRALLDSHKLRSNYELLREEYLGLIEEVRTTLVELEARVAKLEEKTINKPKTFGGARDD